MADLYKVHITRYAYNQMSEIRRYIAEDLFAPDAARGILNAMRKAIGSLASMPRKYRVIDEEPWSTEGIRRLIVKNFYVYYWIDEEKKKVHVTAVVYGKRDQMKQLADMDLG